MKPIVRASLVLLIVVLAAGSVAYYWMFIRQPLPTGTTRSVTTSGSPTPFTFSLSQDFLHVSPGTSRQILVFVERSGTFSDSIRMELANPPSWVAFRPFTINATTKNATMIVGATQDAPKTAVTLTVHASSVDGGYQETPLNLKVVGVTTVTSEYGAAEVYDTTKVLDEETLQALTSYSNDTVVFAKMTGLLQTVERGDVIASPLGASPVVPHGFLRTVLSVQQEGGSVLIRTQQAMLIDAVRKLDVKSPKFPVGGPVASGSSGSDAGPSSFFPTTSFDIGPVNLAPGGDVVAVAHLWFTAGPNWHYSIDCGLFSGCDVDFGVHLAAYQDIDLSLKGKAGSVLNWHEANLGTIYEVSIPILGILWIEIKVTLQGDASGTLQNNLDLNYHEYFGFEVGPDYDDGWHWFQQASGFPPSVEKSGTIEPGSGSDAKIEFGPKLEGSVDGAAGIYIAAQFFGVLNSEIPHKPSWWVDAGIDFRAGLWVDLWIWGTSWDGGPWTLLSFRLFDGWNLAPSVEITDPHDGTTFDYNSLLIFPSFTATASDPETGDLCVGPQDRLVWSDEYGQIATGCSLHAVQLAQDGVHHITFTATDSEGMSSSASVTVTVSAAKPDVSITKPIDNSNFMVGQPVTLEGFAMLGLSPFPCNSASGKLTFSIWLSQSHITSEPESGTQNPLYCTAQTKFDKPGSYYIRLIARDPSGKIQAFSKQVKINIFEPSQGTNLPPIVQVTLPHEGDHFIFSNDKINLQGTVFDPEGDPLGTYTWSYGSSLFEYPLVPITTGPLPPSSTCTKDAPCLVTATLNAHDYCVNNPSGGDLFLTLAATETAPVEQTGYNSPQTIIHLDCGKPLSAPPNLTLGGMFWGGFLTDANSVLRAKPERKHYQGHAFSPVSRF